MYSCDHERTVPTHTPFVAKYQPCIGVVTGRPEHHAIGKLHPPAAPGQAHAAGSAAPQLPQRAAKKRHATAARPSTSRRSSTTVVATDVSNFRAMVQELTGFPAAAIFRPLPRRVPVHAAHQLAAAHGCDGGSGGAVHGHSSDASAASVPAAQLQQCSPPGVFDGLPDLGSPEFDSWPDLSN